MDCPLCKINLQLADRQGVEIDYCPKCRGIWLDRGELEKLVELSAAQTRTSAPPLKHSRDDEYQSDRNSDRADDRYDRSAYPQGKPKKRESWLGELFDFG